MKTKPEKPPVTAKKSIIHVCDNCGKRVADNRLKIRLEHIPDLYQRLDPGGVVPSGECPDCGALTYPEEVKPKIKKGKRLKLRLVFDVTFKPKGENPEELKANMEAVAQHAVNEGTLTGESMAEVETYEFKVEVQP